MSLDSNIRANAQASENGKASTSAFVSASISPSRNIKVQGIRKVVRKPSTKQASHVITSTLGVSLVFFSQIYLIHGPDPLQHKVPDHCACGPSQPLKQRLRPKASPTPPKQPSRFENVRPFRGEIQDLNQHFGVFWWCDVSKVAKTSHHNFAYLPSTWWLHVIQLVIGVGQCHHQKCENHDSTGGLWVQLSHSYAMHRIPISEVSSPLGCMHSLMMPRHQTHQSKNDMYIYRYFVFKKHWYLNVHMWIWYNICIQMHSQESWEWKESCCTSTNLPGLLQRPQVLKVEPNMIQPNARKVEGKVDSKLERKSFELIDIQNYGSYSFSKCN